MTKMKNILMTAIIGSVGISGSAQAACWTPAEADAAVVRNLQSRLMVAALRCGRSEHNLLADYNKFVKSKKPLLRMGNNVLRSHFSKGKSKNQGMKAYDRFAVSMANVYGAGTGDLSGCQEMQELTQSAANSDGSVKTLVSLAQSHALSPDLPGGRCGIVLASNK